MIEIVAVLPMECGDTLVGRKNDPGMIREISDVCDKNTLSRIFF